MRNDECSPALTKPVKTFLETRLGCNIEGRGRFVQDQDRSVLEERPGYCDALTLSPRKPLPPIADRTRIAFRFALDEFRSTRHRRCLADLVEARIRITHRDILADGTIKQSGLLEDDADRRAERCQ